MKITDRLKVEHGVFLAQLRHLEQMVAVRAPAPALAGAIETIARAEAHHSALEDRLLYPALAQKVGEDAAPLRTIKADHQRIQQQLEELRAGDPDVEKTTEFVRTLRSGSARDLSLAMLLLLITGIVLWLAYGALAGLTAVVVANAATLLLTLPILWVKLRRG